MLTFLSVALIISSVTHILMQINVSLILNLQGQQLLNRLILILDKIYPFQKYRFWIPPPQSGVVGEMLP